MKVSESNKLMGSSCPCDYMDAMTIFKKAVIFAVLQKVMDSKIIHKLEKPIEGVESGKVTKGKTMKLNILVKTIVYAGTNYIIGMFKDQIILPLMKIDILKNQVLKNNEPCFCMLVDLISVIVLQILSLIYNKRFKGKDLLNNVVAVYGSSFIYDMYGKSYMNFSGLPIIGRSQDLPSTVQEQTNTSITGQGGDVKVNLRRAL